MNKPSESPGAIENAVDSTNAIAAPFTNSVMTIEPDWIDYNGHLNMAYYLVLFDRASDEAFAALGMGPAYAAQGIGTTYTGDAHIAYLREVGAGAPLVATLQILDHNDKAIHAFQELRHATDGWTAATCESLTLHIDQGGPKVTPFPPAIRAKVDTMAASHARLPRPEGAGRQVGIRRKTNQGEAP